MRKFILTGIFVVSVGVGTAAQSFMSQDFAGAGHRGANVQTKDNTWSGPGAKRSDPEESLLLAQANNACERKCMDELNQCTWHCERYPDASRTWECTDTCLGLWDFCMKYC